MKRLFTGMVALAIAIAIAGSPVAFAGKGDIVVEGKNATSWDTAQRTGFVNRTDSTIAWSDTTPDRTLTIDVAVSSFAFFVQGKGFVKKAAETKQIADTEGLHWIYYDADGALQETTSATAALITDYALVAAVYWDATNNLGELIEERHGIAMSVDTHLYLHNNVGTVWKDGLALGDFTISTGAANSHAQFSTATGEIHDEDIEVTTNTIAVGVGLEIWYLDGSDWRKTTNAGYSILTTGTGRMAYNNSGAQTEVGNTDFALTHVFATTNADGNPIAIQGQSTYNTVGQARTGAETEIANLNTSGLPVTEMKAIGTVIFQTRDSYGNAVKSRIRDTSDGENYIDFRTTAAGTGAPASDHGALAGLGDDDHPQYFHPDHNTEQLAGNKTLVADDLSIQFLDPDGSRDVTLPAEAASTDLMFIIVNAAANPDEIISVYIDSPWLLDTLAPGQSGIYTCDGTNWRGGDYKNIMVDRIDGKVTLTTAIVSESLITAQGSDEASASNITPGDGNYFDITGTTNINTIATRGIGAWITLQFDGILDLVHSADLVLPTGSDITTAAGDIATFYEYASADWRCESYTRADGTALAGGASGVLLLDGSTQMTGTLKTDQGGDVASANNMTLGTDGNFFDITGTTTINTIATKGVGTGVTLQFDGILQLTHSADLFLPTAANITTAAGDIATFYEYASADWRCASYERADGAALNGVALIVTASYGSNQTLSTAECSGATIYVTGAGAMTLPAIFSGASVRVVTIGAIEVEVDANGSDKIWLDGTALDDGDRITNTSTSGDEAVCTYYSGDGWYCATSGWSDGGA